MNKLRPLSDRLVVEREQAPTKTPGGIVLPDGSKDKPQRGMVLAVGPGRFDGNGKRLEMQVKVGDRVLFTQYAGSEIKVDGDKILLLREDEVLAVLTD
jgi:chaperonin GroES